MSWHLIARVAAQVATKKLQTRESDHRRRSTLRRVVVVVGIISAPVTIVFLVMLLGLTAVVAGGPAAAAAGGALGIPPVVFSAYLAAETNASTVTAECRVGWPVIAGIWKVESNHATYRGRTVTPDGTVIPPLLGVTLDGSNPGHRNHPRLRRRCPRRRPDMGSGRRTRPVPPPILGCLRPGRQRRLSSGPSERVRRRPGHRRLPLSYQPRRLHHQN